MPVENGLTRFLALYADAREVPLIGPIRGGRVPMLEATAFIDPIITMVGCSVGFCGAANVLDLAVIDGNYSESDPALSIPTSFHLDGVDYLRSQTDAQGKALPLDNIEGGAACLYIDQERIDQLYPLESCKFTSQHLLDAGSEQGSTRPSAVPDTRFFRFGDTAQNAWEREVTGVAFPFSPQAHDRNQSGSFQYDAAKGQFVKTQFGGPQLDGVTGQQLAFDNLLILYVTVVPSDVVAQTDGQGVLLSQTVAPVEDGSLVMLDFSTGATGYYLRDGQMQTIRWSKAASGDGYVFTDANDEELIIGAGTTYIGFADVELSDAFSVTPKSA